uniref:Ig-like domain-containing protein n=1 Tax=Plectus sambesii TaxID=2011161 RepID=A0A914XCW5_9BILA
MTTLVVLVCILAGCFISAHAGEPTGQPGLSVDVTEAWTKPDVVHPHKKYFVREGSLFHIQCSAPDSTKKEHRVGWIKVDTGDWSTQKVAPPSDKTARLEFTRVNASHAGRYDCVGDHTYANLSVELFVSSDAVAPAQYGPFNESESVSLVCKAEKPVWTFNGLPINDKQVTEAEEGRKLTIEKPVGPRTGVYMCSATSGGVSQSQIFHVRGVPVVSKEHSQGNKNMMEGDNAELKCDVTGYPLPSITWKKNHTESGNVTAVSAKSDKTKFSEHKGIKDAKVSVSNLEFSDSGDYICVAKSELGEVSVPVSLRVKDKLAALWPFLGIVVEVIVLVSIIFIYEKRRTSKDDLPADDEDEEEEQKKALTSGETIDVRQRGVKT